MKVILVSFYEELDTIGLKYLHYTLLKNGYESSILYLPYFNASSKKQLESIKKHVLEMNPALIGISLMSYEQHNAIHLTKYIRSLIPATPVIWGGIHPTISPEDCLTYADYVCMGEGERTMLEIASVIRRNGDSANINNLCYRKNGEVQKNSLYPLIENLDEIPAYEHIPQNSFILIKGKILPLYKKIFRRYARHLGRIYSVITTRGCPFFCTFCCNNYLSRLYRTNKIRKRSAPNVIEELQKSLNDYPEIEYINFQDDCFLASSEDYLKDFYKIYKEKIGKPFIIRSTPIYITRDKIRLLKEAGVAWINVGLQSGSNRILKGVYKRTALKEDFLKAAGIIKEFNLAAFYDIILDNPFEDETDRLDTVEALMNTPKPFYTQFCSLTFFHGTEIYEKAKLEHPEYIRADYLNKNNLIPQKNLVNNLTRLAAFMDERCVAKLIRLYKRNPGSARLKIAISITNILSSFIFQPLTYFLVIKLSQGGSYLRTIKALPIYFKEGFKRYIANLNIFYG